MKTFYAPGNEIEFAVSGTIASGDIVVAGELVGVAAKNYVAGDTGVMEITGIHRLLKATGETWTLGAKVYKVAGAQEVSVSATGNTFLGYASSANSDAASTIGYVLLARTGA